MKSAKRFAKMSRNAFERSDMFPKIKNVPQIFLTYICFKFGIMLIDTTVRLHLHKKILKDLILSTSRNRSK